MPILDFGDLFFESCEIRLVMVRGRTLSGTFCSKRVQRESASSGGSWDEAQEDRLWAERRRRVEDQQDTQQDGDVSYLSNDRREEGRERIKDEVKASWRGV